MSDLRTKVVQVDRGPGLWWVDRATGDKPVPGDIFYAAHELDEPYRSWLSSKYWALPEPRRLPIVVVLPNGVWFCVDQQASGNRGQPEEPGWDVSGSIDCLTVKPSINIVGSWHGYLTDGILRPA
jgi:hypothetical protein